MMRSAAKSAAAVILGVALLGAPGCDDDQPEPPRPMAGRGGGSQASGGAPAAESEPRRAQVQPTRDLGGTGGGTADEGGGAASEDERDVPGLEDALRKAVAGAQGCLPTDEPSLPDEVTVRATVHVSATGIVTRASASGSGLPSQAVRCIEERLQAHRFSTPDESRSASTSVTWRVKRSEPAETETDESEESQAPSQGYAIEGPSGVAIEPTQAQEPTGPGGQPIEPTQGQEPTGPGGQPIEGPSGTPIGE